MTEVSSDDDDDPALAPLLITVPAQQQQQRRSERCVVRPSWKTLLGARTHPLLSAPRVKMAEIQDELRQLNIGSGFRRPVLEAFVYCALRGWGADLVMRKDNDDAPLRFRVWDFSTYYHCAQQICVKPAPTTSLQARLKSLKLWFPQMPTALYAYDTLQASFDLTVRADGQKREATIRAIIKDFVKRKLV